MNKLLFLSILLLTCVLRGKNETCQYVVGLKMTDCFGCQSVMMK